MRNPVHVSGDQRCRRQAVGGAPHRRVQHPILVLGMGRFELDVIKLHFHDFRMTDCDTAYISYCDRGWRVLFDLRQDFVQ